MYLLDGAHFDSNIFLIDEELLVDCGTGIFFSQTIEQMKGYGLNPKKITKIVITHAHFDHCGGVKKFKELTGADVFIHKLDADKLRNGDVLENFLGMRFKFAKFEPDKILEGGETISTDCNDFIVLHTPGHTSGSISLWNKKNKILICGDLIFHDGFGRTDLKDGSESDIKKSLLKIKELHPNILLPGHGTILDIKNEYNKEDFEKIFQSI